MLLAVDVGNSRIKFGLYQDRRAIRYFTLPTSDARSDGSLLSAAESIDDGVSLVRVCSVVPPVNDVISKLASRLNSAVEFIDHRSPLGIEIEYDPPETLGVDRLTASAAAYRKYGGPCITCSFGTATTIDAVTADGRFIGGTIAPGLRTMAEALHLKTAKLPLIDVGEVPSSAIGRSTTEAISAGVFFSHIGAAEAIISRIKAEIGDAKVVATGGFAKTTAEHSHIIDAVDETLILDGLAAMA